MDEEERTLSREENLERLAELRARYPWLRRHRTPSPTARLTRTSIEDSEPDGDLDRGEVLSRDESLARLREIQRRLRDRPI
jgi:hypothetical protein